MFVRTPSPSFSLSSALAEGHRSVPAAFEFHPQVTAQVPAARDLEWFRLDDQDFVSAEPVAEDADPQGHDFDAELATSFDTPVADAAAPPTYEASLKKSRRRRRAATVATPPLPPGFVPDDDRTRFNWQDRALSRKSHASGRYWFPDAWKTRVFPPITKLSEIDSLWPELQRYSEHFLPLLQAEQAEAEAQFNARLREWPDDQLRREGFMLDEMAGSVDWQPKFKVEGSVVTFTKTGQCATRPLPPHQFEPGATVLLSRTDPLVNPVMEAGDCQPLKGNVLSYTRGFIRVVFPEVPIDLDSGHWRIDIGCSDFAIRRQCEAIDRLNVDPVSQDIASVSGRTESSPSPPTTSMEDEVLHENRRKRNNEQQILIGTGLRDLLLRRFQSEYLPPQAAQPSNELGDPVASVPDVASETIDMKPSDMDATVSPTPHLQLAPRGIIARNDLIDSWTRRYRTREGQTPVTVEGDPEIPLNPSQMRAIAMMLSERMSLVQGPPGTGKTRVIVETIKLLKVHWQIPHPILVCAHTNVAVDNLLDGLQSHGVKALRFGSVGRVPEALQELTLEARIEKHPVWAEMERIKAERITLQQKLASGQLSKWAAQEAQTRCNAISGRLWGLKRRVQFEVLSDADVVCTTCLSATSRLLDAVDFPFVFLDEASMATEPLSLVPLTKGAQQVAIIGDHKQLPPVIISEKAQAGGLGTSLFERLMHEHHIPSIMLDTQYRMHPSISAFSNETFYGGTLKDGTVLSDGSVQLGLEPPTTAFLLSDEGGQRKNVTFLNHNFPESPLNRSIANFHEAGRVCDIIADLLGNNPDLKGSDIGVIAPYTAQIRTISEFLTMDPARTAAFKAWLGAERAAEVANIEVKTVDGFEGREKQVIVFSTVRSNEAGYIGFLADWRRLNVGLTRAKRGLIMLGSARTLSQARTGSYASDALPKDGAKVWRQFMRHLRDGGMIMDDS